MIFALQHASPQTQIVAGRASAAHDGWERNANTASVTGAAPPLLLSSPNSPTYSDLPVALLAAHAFCSSCAPVNPNRLTSSA